MNKSLLKSTLTQHANLVGQYSPESITDEDFVCAIRLIKKDVTKEISRWAFEDQVVIQSKFEAVCALQSSRMQMLKRINAKASSSSPVLNIVGSARPVLYGGISMMITKFK